jgi:alpha-beta hydrolase superfamily lysophospholipase
MRRALVVVAAMLSIAAVSPAAALAVTRQDLTIRMSDGVDLAATLHMPDDLTSESLPAVILLHGLGEHRNKLNAVGITTNDVAEQYLASRGYVALTFDQRGQGASGGLHGLAGPRDVSDVRELFEWLDTRPRVDRARIGAYAYSGGGGTLWRAAAEGLPFAAITNAITWTDLYRAIVPQNLTKSGAALGYLNAQVRYTPELLAQKDDLYFSRNLPAIKTTFDALSVKDALGRIRVPTLLMQGRRDFLFDLEHAFAAYRRLAGPKRLYLADFGHAPSSLPREEIPHAMTLARRWFDRWLRGVPNGVDTEPAVELARDPWNGSTASFRSLPATRNLIIRFRRGATIRGEGKVVRTARVGRLTETLGSGTLRVTASGTASWSHLVAVVAARTPAGRTVVVSEGGVPMRLGARGRTFTIRLLSTATSIPAGSRLELTLAATSTAQNPSNLLYLVPVPEQARLTVRRAELSLPVLRQPVSR